MSSTIQSPEDFNTDIPRWDLYVESVENSMQHPETLVGEAGVESLNRLLYDTAVMVSEPNWIEKSPPAMDKLPYCRSELIWIRDLRMQTSGPSMFREALQMQSGNANLLGRLRDWLIDSDGGPYKGQAEKMIRGLRGEPS